MYQGRRLRAEVSPLLAVLSPRLRTSTASKPRAPLVPGRHPARGSEHRLHQRDRVKTGALRLGASDLTHLPVRSSLFAVGAITRPRQGCHVDGLLSPAGAVQGVTALPRVQAQGDLSSDLCSDASAVSSKQVSPRPLSKTQVSFLVINVLRSIKSFPTKH